MDKPKPGLPTVEVAFGMTLPLIADLGDGWCLAAHPGGPTIATKTQLACLHVGATEIPDTIREKAVRAFEEFAWPLVREKFYDKENVN